MLDIETAPNVAYVWGLFKENIPLDRLIDSGYVMCWAAKWYGSKEVMFESLLMNTPKQMLSKIHKLLDEADVVVHYYGSSFDIPTLNKEFVQHGMMPPAPYKEIDLLNTVRKTFRFTSNKLDHVCERLGLGNKHNTTFDMWVKCMNKDKDAWDKMKKYNKQDVLLLEKLYVKLLPWIKNHANYSVFRGEVCCPNCGSKELEKRGFYYTSALQYQRFMCKSCGKWSRSRTTTRRGVERLAAV